MRFAARVDDNQAVIVKALRKAGCEVLSLAGIGDGCGDLLVNRANILYMLEVKDGAKSPSRRKLTPHQKLFAKRWPVQEVINELEALAAVGL